MALQLLKYFILYEIFSTNSDKSCEDKYRLAFLYDKVETRSIYFVKLYDLKI